MFSLTLSELIEQHEEAAFYRGTIRMGDFEEDFLAAASLWTPDRYRRQWKEAATALTQGAIRTAFITSFVHPDAINVLWPAWREKDLVYIQNLLSLPELRQGLLDPDRVSLHVGERRTSSADRPPSEWVVSLRDIATFAA